MRRRRPNLRAIRRRRRTPFPRDGNLDIVSPTFTAIQTLRGNGDGTFTAGPTTTVPGATSLSGIAAAKENADSIPDLFAIDGGSGTAFALCGSGTGSFSVTGTLALSGLIPEDVAAADLNGDGIDDIGIIGSFSFTVNRA